MMWRNPGTTATETPVCFRSCRTTAHIVSIFITTLPSFGFRVACCLIALPYISGQRLATNMGTTYLVPHHYQAPAPLLGAAKATATSAPLPTGRSSSSHDAAAATASRFSAALEAAVGSAGSAVWLSVLAPDFAAQALLWAAASANSAAKHRCRPHFACQGHTMHIVHSQQYCSRHPFQHPGHRTSSASCGTAGALCLNM